MGFALRYRALNGRPDGTPLKCQSLTQVSIEKGGRGGSKDAPVWSSLFINVHRKKSFVRFYCRKKFKQGIKNPRHNIRSTTSIATWARMYSRTQSRYLVKKPKLKTAWNRCQTVSNYMVNSILVVFFYLLQPITTDLIFKNYWKKSLAPTLFSKLCQCIEVRQNCRKPA